MVVQLPERWKQLLFWRNNSLSRAWNKFHRYFSNESYTEKVFAYVCIFQLSMGVEEGGVMEKDMMWYSRKAIYII